MPMKKKQPKNGKYYAQGREWTAKQYKKFRTYQTNYNKEHYKMFGIRFDKTKDKRIIKWLESKESLNAYIKSIIEADMKKK